MHRRPRHLAALVCLCAATQLFTACSGEDGKAAPSSHSASHPASKRKGGAVNRDDVNGDGHADVVVNGWYRVFPKLGVEWHRKRFVALAAPGGPEPGTAFRLPERLPRVDQRISSGPVGHDQSTQFTGDLDDDGYADVVAGDVVPDSSGKYAPDQRIVWGGPDGPRGDTKLPAGVLGATACGDFDGDGALDLLTLATPSFSESATEPQPATVLYGPLRRDGAVPRTTSTTDVGYQGKVSVAHTVVGDFDGDGRDDVVTKGEYDEEDARIEEGLPEGVTDATFYRGTAKGLKPAGSVPGITGTAGSIPVASGDFDGDDKQDLLARGQGHDRAVAVYGSSKGPGRGKARAGGLGTLKVGLDVAVGDINGDGYDDTATQSRGDDDRVGQVMVVFGGKGGLSAARAVTIDRYAIGLGGSPRSPGDRDYFGWDLYLADLDTDGRDELLIGTFGFKKPRKDAGYWILRGTEDGPSKTDRRFIKTTDVGTS
ncbi:VCBS repeat-containing protein [Streptomyces sp. ME19-01-6]|uniref:FG-GAP repeat domain-containing protein n=1 Tax=Streptomyces sp. ME19-01-6 TaxID=3028686 RepID=UPI0029B93016|nr:VCBS repeat-containing protein [Streptomyces sp. ME19-01-6]MDX3225118.1 VCBS repeat-containing protein [Streptomyces sp. ME19-01-6]